MILLKLQFLGIDSDGSNARFNASVLPVIIVSVPPNLKGTKATHVYQSNEILDAVTEPDVKFDTVKEEWNEYQLPENVTISAKIIMTQLSRTSLYDMFGDPLFRIQHQSVVKSTLPASAREKYVQMLKPSAPTQSA
jgi:hypothetical protein